MDLFYMQSTFYPDTCVIQTNRLYILYIQMYVKYETLYYSDIIVQFSCLIVFQDLQIVYVCCCYQT